MENTFERACRRFDHGLYHSAAGDYLVFLWEGHREDPRSVAAREGLLQCGIRLRDLRFHESARSVFEKLMHLCPQSEESLTAGSALRQASDAQPIAA